MIFIYFFNLYCCISFRYCPYSLLETSTSLYRDAGVDIDTQVEIHFSSIVIMPEYADLNFK